MARIEWDKSLSVDNDELDEQHKQLIHFYNTLHESLINDPPEKTTRTKITTLDNLVDYAQLHFAAEEKHLAEIGFPERESHRRVHQEFSEKVLALQRDIAANKPVLGTSLIKFLRNWIVEHIARDDKAFATYLKKP